MQRSTTRVERSRRWGGAMGRAAGASMEAPWRAGRLEAPLAGHHRANTAAEAPASFTSKPEVSSWAGAGDEAGEGGVLVGRAGSLGRGRARAKLACSLCLRQPPFCCASMKPIPTQPPKLTDSCLPSPPAAPSFFLHSPPAPPIARLHVESRSSSWLPKDLTPFLCLYLKEHQVASLSFRVRG